MKIQLKRSNVLASGAAKQPTASQLEYGELAINYNTDDPALFLKDSNNNIIRISGVGNIADDGLTNVPAGTNPPTNPTPESGNLWYNSDDGRLYIYYVDADTSQWVDASPDSWDPTVMPVTTNPAAQTGTLDDRYVMENGDTMTGDLVMNNANIIFEGSIADDFETTLTVSNPTADRTLTLPNVSGALVSTGDSDTVTGTMISNNTISDTNINSSAAIAGTKINPNFGGQDITTTGSINVDTVSDNSHVKILTGSTPAERFRIAVGGQIGLSGENYGTVGQVITSNGSNNAPTWETIDSQTLAGVAASNYVRSDQGDSLTGTYTITSTSTDTPALKIFHDDFDEGLIIHRNHSTNNPAIVFENTTAQQGILHADNGVLTWRSGTGSVDGTIYTSADGVALTSGATFTGDVRIDGDADLRVGDGAANERILIQKADNNVSDHIIFYNGTSRVGEIGCEDTTYLRLNQETDKPIYTPRYIRADSGFFVDGTSKGINGSGNFVGGTIAGASDYSTLLRSNAADTMTGMLTLNHAGDEMLRLQDTSSSGNPYVTWYQAGTRRAYIQYIDSGDKLYLKNDAGNTGLTIDGGTSGLQWSSGSSTWTVWHSGNDGSGSGLAADTLDGYHASTSRSSANTIPIRNSSGYMDLGWINTTSGSTTNTITKVYATYGSDAYIRYCTPNHLANAMSNVVKTAGSSMSGTLYRGSSTAGQSNTTTGWALGNGTLHASGSATPVCFNVNANTVLCSLRRSGTQKGRINVDTSRAYFYATSDYRLKENVSLMTDGIERVKRLKPSYFRWIESQDSDEGFIAHELAEVCPGAVDGEKDAVDDAGNIKEQAVEYSYVTPVLTAAIKELIQKVETLEQQVATLTGA